MEEKVELKVVQQMKAFSRVQPPPFLLYVQDSISSTCEQLNERTGDKRSVWKRKEAFCLELACPRNRPIADTFRPPSCQALASCGGSRACLWSSGLTMKRGSFRVDGFSRAANHSMMRGSTLEGSRRWPAIKVRSELSIARPTGSLMIANG